MKKKIVGFIIGAVLGIGLWQGIKAIPIFPMIFKCASYFFLAFWSSVVYPMIAIKLNIFEKENA